MQRREFVEAVSASLAAALAAAAGGRFSTTAAYATELQANAPYEFLTADQARLLDVITAHIVPTDETPGAREAHVVRYIDHAFATFLSDYRKDFSETLATFNEFMATFRPDGAPFVSLRHGEQIAALHDLERLKPDIFGPLRDLTMTGMFVHPEHGGNYQKIGWKLIGYVDQYSWAPPFGYYDRGRA
jgi:gluconate 2-dehydrogenase gamma chain